MASTAPAVTSHSLAGASQAVSFTVENSKFNSLHLSKLQRAEVAHYLNPFSSARLLHTAALCSDCSIAAITVLTLLQHIYSVVAAAMYLHNIRNPDWYGQYIFADYEARILARLQYDGEGKPWKAYQIADANQGKLSFIGSIC
jgi:hypothetical protein